ncbi:hypothetical protein BB559_000006 [Furculomyces boomerangus]|uniref:Importin N-terminal domain-containing protein n=2 Tax=Harpellales TaxID=61421 RepID=A0A2T9Z6K7_9FUNG|nr:hypothetical protein BB559_000006 [Furculomyces boomerangus]PVZ99377.1 hypothetical protein BB558_004610 [Smittium angustum]
MSDSQELIAQCLLNSLSPDATIRKQAELSLTQMESTKAIALPLLQLVSNSQLDEKIRMSSALYFKNFIKRNWEQNDEIEDVINKDDRDLIKKELVLLMINLPKSMQLQIGEAVSIIADNDFPGNWQNLIKDLVGHFSLDIQTNNGILKTAHMIFNRYRSDFRTDMLFSEIKYVLEQFAQPYYQVFKATDQLLTNFTKGTNTLDLLESIKLLIVVFYDLNCQDLPEFFEDHMAEFMEMFHRYLQFDYRSVGYSTDDYDEDEQAGIVEEIKAEVLKVIHLYSQRYEEDFKQLPIFLETTWNMLTTIGTQKKNDIVVIQGISFLTTMVKNHRYKQTFLGNNMIQTICEKIVIRNIQLSVSDEELFEDDPIMFVRRELEGQEAETRRNAASDLVKGMLQQFGTETTQAMLHYIMKMLDEYAANPAQMWKSKDTAQFMVTSISAMASVKSLGVTQTNSLVDLTDFYQTQMLPHLTNIDSDRESPILKSNAIKYFYVFRNQLSIPQIEATLPLLVNHLSHPSPVVSTFSALAIERILVLKRNGAIVIGEQKLLPYSQTILEKLFTLILSQHTPEKLAENDFYIKLIMRVILTCRQSVSNIAVFTFEKLASILEIVCKNPSNPMFNHFLFESIASLSRFTCETNPSVLESIENSLFPRFQMILENEISEFMPYVFQILSLLLQLHKNSRELPVAYSALLQPLLQPVLWDYQGNIPALVKLLQSYFSASGPQLAETGKLGPILGIFQKLVSTKANDQYAFDLLSSIVLNVPAVYIKQYLRDLLMLMLNRLQSKKTPKFVRNFVQFIGFFCAQDAMNQLASNPDEESHSNLLGLALENIQPQLFKNILCGVLLDAISTNSGLLDIKSVAVGYFCLINSSFFLSVEGSSDLYPTVLSRLVTFIEDSSSKVSSEKDQEHSQDLDSLEISETVYQSSYSKLATISSFVLDPCPEIKDPRSFIGQLIKVKIGRGDTFASNAIQKLNDSDKQRIEQYIQL